MNKNDALNYLCSSNIWLKKQQDSFKFQVIGKKTEKNELRVYIYFILYIYNTQFLLINLPYRTSSLVKLGFDQQIYISLIELGSLYESKIIQVD